MPHTRRVRIGVAVSASGVTFSVNGRSARSIDLPLADASDRAKRLGDSLNGALNEIGAAKADLHVAVMPDAVRCRILDIPRLGRETVHALVSSNVNRFFLFGDRSVSVGAWQTRRNRQLTTFVAAAFDDVLEPLRAACGPICRIASIVPAHAAWAAGAARSCAGQHSVAVAVVDDICELVAVKGRRVALLRRLPVLNTSAVVAAIAELAASQPPAKGNATVLLITSRADLDDVHHHLEAQQISVVKTDGTPESVAARYAVHARAPRLFNDSEHANHLLSSRKQALRRTLVALALLVTVASLELTNAARDAEGLRDLRSQQRAEVAAASNVLQEVASLRREIAAIDSLPDRRRRASDLVAQLAEFLPNDSYVTDFSISQDTARVGIRGEDAAAAFSRLRRSMLMARAEADGSLRRILDADGIASEAITLRLGLGKYARGNHASQP